MLVVVVQQIWTKSDQARPKIAPEMAMLGLSLTETWRKGWSRAEFGRNWRSSTQNRSKSTGTWPILGTPGLHSAEFDRFVPNFGRNRPGLC